MTRGCVVTKGWADWLGKHISDADAAKVDRIAGKISCSSEIPACAGMTDGTGVTSCAGNVEMYVKDDITDPALSKLLAYHATCPITELKEKSLKLTAADGSEKEVAIGSCYFDCNELTDVLKDNYVSFLYSAGTGATSEFVPLPAVKISDLMDVIFYG